MERMDIARGLTCLLIFVGAHVAIGQNGPVYKAVIYDNNGVEMVGRQVQTKLTVSELVGQQVFVQENTLLTDSLGVLTVRFNDGNIITGTSMTLLNLDYTSQDYFLKVEVDTTMGSSSGYLVYSNSLIGPSFFSYKSNFSDTADVSRDNLLEKVGSVTKMLHSGGIIISSITTTERDSIQQPLMGLLVYLNDQNDFSYYNGTSWIELGSIQDLEAFKKEIRTMNALRHGQ